jgi:lipopolysaccharide heptosyltransferase I
MKILVVRLGALGDIVHAVPAVAALRRGLPSAQIDWLVDERHREVVDLVRGIDARIPVDPSGRWRELPRVIRRLRGEGYDAALDFQGLLKSAVLARLSGARRVIGFSREALRERTAAMFYQEHQSAPRGQHVIAKNLRLAGVLGVDVSQILFPFDVPPEPLIEGRYAILNPGAAWPNKRWPAQRFGEIAAWLREHHGIASLVLWGPRELALAREVADASAGAARAAPPTRIGDVLALARGARLMVSGDTGPLHLAAAVGTPLVGLYGPTSPLRNGPWRPEDVSISQNAECVCHHRRRCRRQGLGPCIEQITVAQVRAAIEQRLRG